MANRRLKGCLRCNQKRNHQQKYQHCNFDNDSTDETQRCNNCIEDDGVCCAVGKWQPPVPLSSSGGNQKPRRDAKVDFKSQEQKTNSKLGFGKPSYPRSGARDRRGRGRKHHPPPPPPLAQGNWEQCLDSDSGNYYWHDRSTGKVQWEAPTPTAPPGPPGPPPAPPPQAQSDASSVLETAEILTNALCERKRKRDDDDDLDNDQGDSRQSRKRPERPESDIDFKFKGAAARRHEQRPAFSESLGRNGSSGSRWQEQSDNFRRSARDIFDSNNGGNDDSDNDSVLRELERLQRETEFLRANNARNGDLEYHDLHGYGLSRPEYHARLQPAARRQDERTRRRRDDSRAAQRRSQEVSVKHEHSPEPRIKLEASDETNVPYFRGRSTGAERQHRGDHVNSHPGLAEDTVAERGGVHIKQEPGSEEDDGGVNDNEGRSR